MTVPEVLYKFSPPTSLDYYLINNSIRFSSVRVYNDVLEFTPEFSHEHSRRLAGFVSDFEEVVRDDGFQEDPLVLLKQAGYTLEIQEAILARQLWKVGQQLASCFYTVCLSEDWSNNLMWGHYASSGQGVVFGLDTGSNFILSSGGEYCDPLVKVTYSDVRPSFKERTPKEKFMAALSTKSIDWSYEQEWRVVRECEASESDYLYDNLEFGEIKEILIGPDCSFDIVKRIVKLNDEKWKADLYICYVDPKEYKLCRTRLNSITPLEAWWKEPDPRRGTFLSNRHNYI